MPAIGMLNTEVKFTHRREWHPGIPPNYERSSIDYLDIQVYDRTDTGHTLMVTVNGITMGDICSLITNLDEVANKMRLGVA